MEPVLHSLEFHNIFRLNTFDTLLFPDALSSTSFTGAYLLLVLEVVQVETFNNVLFDLTRSNMTVGIQECVQVGQSDVVGEPGDGVEHDGNACLLRVCLDVIDTFLDALGRSLCVLCLDMLGHPLLVIPLGLHLVLEGIILVRQPLPLGPAVSELHVHTSHGEESTKHLNKDPNRVPALSLLGSLYKVWWWCFGYRVRGRQVFVFNVDGQEYFCTLTGPRDPNKCVSYLFEIRILKICSKKFFRRPSGRGIVASRHVVSRRCFRHYVDRHRRVPPVGYQGTMTSLNTPMTIRRLT